MRNRTVSVIGLGKLGLCLAASLAKRGINVLGVDIVPEAVDALNRGRTVLCEPGLSELLAELKGPRVTATLSHSEAIEQTDVSCIMVHTPSADDGHFSNQYVLRAIDSLGHALRESGKAYHLFIINSTVMPGTMESKVVPLLERTSGRELNRGFGLCYSPELVALGSVIRDFLRPDLVPIGSSDERAGQMAEVLYGELCENNPPIFHMSLIDAEIFKISLNCYVTLKISFANALANLCERIPGANVDAVTRALGADHRIAPSFLQGGLAFGGTCFPRDTRAYRVLARRYGLNPVLVEAVETVNRSQDRHLADLVLREAEALPEKVVAVLGLAFKPNTNVIEESPAVKLIHELLQYGVEVWVHDPLAMENVRAIFGGKIHYAGSVRDCLARPNVCVITTPDKHYAAIDQSYIPHHPTTIVDCWRLLEPSRLAPQTKYIALGVGRHVESAAEVESQSEAVTAQQL